MNIPISLELLQTAFKVYAYFAVARALLQYLDADFNNKISQIIFNVTRLPISLLRIFVPRVGGKDHGSPLVLALLVVGVERFLYISTGGVSFNILGLLALSTAKVIDIGLSILIIAILARVVMSWVSNRITNFYRLVLTVTEPLMYPIRRRMPMAFGGLDFSPIIVLILLELIDWMIVGSLESVGYRMFL